MFSFDFIFVPIHEALHWSLVIVCQPGFQGGVQPLLLHLDSMDGQSVRVDEGQGGGKGQEDGEGQASGEAHPGLRAPSRRGAWRWEGQGRQDGVESSQSVSSWANVWEAK